MLTPDDPRVTAAALGELSAEEQTAFDQELAAAAPEVRAQIQATLRETVALSAQLRSLRRAELGAAATGGDESRLDAGAPAAKASRISSGSVPPGSIAQRVLQEVDPKTGATSPRLFEKGSSMSKSRHGANQSGANPTNAWRIWLATAASLVLVVVAVWAVWEDGSMEAPMAMVASGDSSQSRKHSEPPTAEAPGVRLPGDAEEKWRNDMPAVGSMGADGGSNQPAGVADPHPYLDAAANPRPAVEASASGNFSGGYGGTGGGDSGGANLAGQDMDNQGRTTNGDDAVNLPPGHAIASPKPDGTSPSTTPTNTTATWKRSSLTPNASRLKIGDNRELPLEGMQANVQIDGFRARVLLDLYFYNDQANQLEADFQLRLPPEASLYYFAFGETSHQSPDVLKQSLAASPVFFSIERSRQLSLDPKRVMADRGESWIQPKEARVVPREKAAFAYGETIRRRVDPALVEWAGAGVFNARVFPVQPRKLHRIVVGYDVNLTQEQGDLVYRFAAPYAKQAIVDLRVARMDGVDVTISPDVQAFSDDQQSHYRVENPTEIIELRQKQPGNVLLVGQGDDSNFYFSGRVEPQLPEVTEMKSPRDGVFLVDTSLSANPDRFNMYLKLLETMLRENRETTPRFAVLFFNAHTKWWQQIFVPNTEENAAALASYAQTLSLEGATDLAAAAAEAVRPAWYPVAEAEQHPRDYFLLSDGAMTWGERDAQAIAAIFSEQNDPVFAYTTNSAGDDVQALSTIASASGGAVFAVVAEDQITKVAKAHLGRPWELLETTLVGGDDLLLAGNPRTIYPGGLLQVVGRGQPTGNTSVTLSVRRGEDERQLEVPFAHVLPSTLAARNYGQVAVAGLEEFVAETEDTATAYARHFRITGQTCSLLMLETEADYDRFNIKPEEDAFVVSRSLAKPLIYAARASQADRRMNSKADFVAWLDRLHKMPGMEFEIPAAMKLMLDDLPEGTFQVRTQPLQPQFITWAQIPTDFQDKELTAQYLSYDAVNAEAERRRAAAGPDDALLALSSLVESSPGDFVLLRDVAYSALELGKPDQAMQLFRQVAKARPYEPQTYHALARCAEQMGNADLALVYYELCVRGNWSDRFGEFKQIVGLDYLRLLKQIEEGKTKSSAQAFAASRLNTANQEFSAGMPDLVITMAWNTDNTDVDLHVTDPRGEECFYSHRDTQIGGHITTDVTQGYGPEMFLLRKAVPGTFRVQAHYFASDANRMGARTRVFLRIYENWGTPNETVTSRTVLLREGQEMHDVAAITIGQPK